MGIIADGNGVVTVHHTHLLLVDLLAMLSEVVGPPMIDEGLVEDAEVFLCRQRITADDVALC